MIYCSVFPPSLSGRGQEMQFKVMHKLVSFIFFPGAASYHFLQMYNLVKNNQEAALLDKLAVKVITM